MSKPLVPSTTVLGSTPMLAINTTVPAASATPSGSTAPRPQAAPRPAIAPAPSSSGKAVVTLSPRVAAARGNPHGILDLFVERWSPRAFRAEPVPKIILDKMVEAARWAPSSINLQPWRFFITAAPQDIGTTSVGDAAPLTAQPPAPTPTRAAWNTAVGERNRQWSDKAPVLVWVVARTTLGPNPYMPPEAPNRHAAFDTGAATVQFVLEGERHGVKSHYMGGVDTAKAHALLGLPSDHEVICAIALGYPADPATLDDGFRAREVPSPRLAGPDIARFL